MGVCAAEGAAATGADEQTLPRTSVGLGRVADAPEPPGPYPGPQQRLTDGEHPAWGFMGTVRLSAPRSL